MAADEPTDRWSRGVAAYASQFGIGEDEVPARMTAMLGERMAGEAISAAGGGAWVEDCLTLRERSLIVVASLVTQGDAAPRLRAHLRWALEHGATREELEALITLLAIYAGYPRASVAMELLRDELAT
jgi:4-carboxymuconolactone decarboxylase